VFSSIDHGGRYAFANQPAIAQWNCARLAETLLALIADDPQAAVEPATAVVRGFSEAFAAAWQTGLMAKIGLPDSPRDAADLDLAADLLAAMRKGRADFTLTFRRLCDAAQDARADESVRSLFAAPEAFDAWAARWRDRLAADPRDPADRAAQMRSVNPAVIPRNHRVEAALAAAAEGDMGPFFALHRALATPFEENAATMPFMAGPDDPDRPYRTFCGT
jgi:uncharacterized protein YdiU (UPF0061 family)